MTAATAEQIASATRTRRRRVGRGIVWGSGGAPGEINEQLNAGYAYTSIATILTRLQAKGLVERSPVGRAFAYRASVDEPDLTARRIAALLDSSSDRTQVLSRFIDGLPSREAKAVRALLEQATRTDKRG